MVWVQLSGVLSTEYLHGLAGPISVSQPKVIVEHVIQSESHNTGSDGTQPKCKIAPEPWS